MFVVDLDIIRISSKITRIYSVARVEILVFCVMINDYTKNLLPFSLYLMNCKFLMKENGGGFLEVRTECNIELSPLLQY